MHLIAKILIIACARCRHRIFFLFWGCKMLLCYWSSASLRTANRIIPVGFLPRYWGASLFAAL